MTFYKSRPVTVEAYRFDGSGPNAQNIIDWVLRFAPDNTPIFHQAADPWESEDGTQGHSGWPAHLFLNHPNTKVADVGDYVVRVCGVDSNYGISESDTFIVVTEEDFKSAYDHFCPNCSGRIRETTNLVCNVCHHDYSKGF